MTPRLALLSAAAAVMAFGGLIPAVVADSCVVNAYNSGDTVPVTNLYTFDGGDGWCAIHFSAYTLQSGYTYLACDDSNSCKVGTSPTGCPDWDVPCDGDIVFSEDPAEPGVLSVCIQAPGADNCTYRRRQRQRAVLASAQQGTTPSFVGSDTPVGGSTGVAEPSSTSGPAGRLLRGATA